MTPRTAQDPRPGLDRAGDPPVEIDEVNQLSREKREQRGGRKGVDRRERELRARMDAADGDPVWLPFRNLAIIVGAMKAGTTTLYYYLRKHPAIAENLRTKEPNFFGRPGRPDAADAFEKGWPWYLAQWDFDPARHRWALEASTSYTKAPTFASSFERMRTLPLVYRFIYILRDPVDRLESQIKHSMARGRVRVGSYPLLGEGPLAASRYATQIDHILEHFDRENLLLLSFTDLCERPARVLADVHRFLGLDDHDYGDIQPQNTRVVKVSGREWSLSEDERRRVYQALEPDIQRLRDVHGFPVAQAFPTVARLAQDAAPPAQPADPEAARREVVQRLRGAMEAFLPPGAVVAVVSRGDDELVRLGGMRTGWHFPSAPDGGYLGHHPADSEEAIRHLEAVRERGADFLLIPEPSAWWLDHYEGFARHVADKLTRVLDLNGTGSLWAFHRVDPVAAADAAIDAALSAREAVDLSWLGPLPRESWTLAPDALGFLAALVAEVRPRHVLELGPGLSTRVIARIAGRADPGAAVTSVDHDPDFLRIAERELDREAARHVVFQAAPLVLRRCFGRLVPVYRIDPGRVASPLPADLVVIDGPPSRCGGREGTLYQALEYCRPGTIVVLDDAGRDAEKAALARWRRQLGRDIAVRAHPEFERGLATVVVRSARRRCGLNEPAPGRKKAP